MMTTLKILPTCFATLTFCLPQPTNDQLQVHLHLQHHQPVEIY